MPTRIQRKRIRGWRAPAGAIYVGRGSRWGNPYRVETGRDGYGDDTATVRFPDQPRKRHFFDQDGQDHPRIRAAAYAVELYEQWITGTDLTQLRLELGGHDLMCWCPLLDETGATLPCHADVLLHLANPTPIPSTPLTCNSLF